MVNAVRWRQPVGSDPDIARSAPRRQQLVGFEESLHRRGMHGTRAGVKIASGPRFRIEMAVVVATSYQGGSDAYVVDQPAVRRDVADADADAPLGGAVRLRRMHEMGVVQ